jgi:branched-chain amino acid transport system substrate-binding protein
MFSYPIVNQNLSDRLARAPSKRWRALLLIAFSYALTNTGALAQANTVRFGMSGPFTGNNKAVGEDFRAGIDACVANANATSKGRKYELIAYDDESKPERVAENARKLLTSDRAVAMLAQANTPSVLAMQPVLKELNAVLIGTGPGTAEFLAPENANIYLVKASYKRETDAILNHLKTAQISKIGFFLTPNAFGKSVWRDVEPKLAELGIKPVAVVEHADSPTEIKPESIRKMIDAKPDAIVFISNAAAATKLVADTAAAGYNGFYFGMSIVATGAFVNSLKPGQHSRIRLTRVTPLPTMTRVPTVRSYLDGAKRANVKPSLRSMEGYIACRVAVAATQKIGGNVSKDSVTRALSGLKLNLGGHEIDYTSGQREGSRFVDLVGLRADGSFIY